MKRVAKLNKPRCDCGALIDQEVGCEYCAGSGEGMHDGTKCMHCNGWGSYPDHSIDQCEVCKDDSTTSEV